MTYYDLTTPQPPEPSVFDLTQPNPMLVAIDEKLNYVADLLETALKLEYLVCRQKESQ